MAAFEIRKKHKYKGDFNECPHCGCALRWIYDGDGWLPCDHEPLMFILHPTGTRNIVYEKHLYTNGLIYRKGDHRFVGKPMQGNELHYYSCPVIRERRREYAIKKRMEQL